MISPKNLLKKKEKKSLVSINENLETDYNLDVKYLDGDYFEVHEQESDYSSLTMDQIYSNLNWRSNTNYIVCDKVSVLNPPERFCKSSEGPLFISLLFPSNEKDPPLQVTCQVVEMDTF